MTPDGRPHPSPCHLLSAGHFTAPFYFAFIWFKVQGSRFRALVAASPPFRREYSRIAAFPFRVILLS